ncbi:polynucleotide adenylyltransferase PcnB [Cellvibrio japonicus]|uniref:Poly(A) polymerase I n=1 Tax=Cellvibrio japonicus (strain Ueda107) TaxID=498211 RepID=B3PI49_CELJU|nr:polynucleotide adenylyltransferase PcnB [Cellvibrio japonicus]ACE83431.1 polynucleotide adenylyltransferase [Cellvibrio japonicus Ueda107]QEI11098.1 polynucleotide adenylyltransferase PcnB [Cellvibrio japonicus]QEI14672.1 polynucleotide adenylyltransferase PcnB [Cellvibrio japonicus]QEI18252.1 polynucleotide adenylyltransferase PcnB [Cellvibrio japonicus]
MLKRLLNLIIPRPRDSASTSSAQSNARKPRVIPRDQHGVSRKNISQAALKIIKQLHEAGFEAYLVGGGVRDLLLGGHPKDFDVATNAKPEEVRRLFRGARIVGRRFQIVHVRIGREMIEVTTFRGHHDEDLNHTRNEDGMLLRDNVYGTLETDAMRRDFSVNALYYDLKTFSIIDYCGGMEDLKKRTLRIIGEPVTRYKEDPVRILRALRFAAKLGFALEPSTAKPIRPLGNLLLNVSEARLFEEVLKLFLNGSATATFNLMREYDLLQQLFPGTDEALKANEPAMAELVELCMANTDKRIRSDKTVTPAFIYAALLWPGLQRRYLQLQDSYTPAQAWNQAAQDVINQQLTRTSIPKRFLIPMREIWDLQQRLPNRLGLRALRLLDHPRFRAAYDFLLMREEAGEPLDGLGSWWTHFQGANDEEREAMVRALSRPTGSGKPRRRRPRKPRNAGDSSA